MNLFAYRALAIVLVVAAIFLAGWWNGASRADRAWQERAAQQERESAEQMQSQAQRIAAIDREHAATLREKDHEIDRLRADVAAGAVRLRVAARCPVPVTNAGAGVGDGAAARPDPAAGPAGDAYLDPAAEPAYFELRAGIARQAEQLRACQSILTLER